MAYATHKMVTGKCRLSFPSLLKPSAYEKNEPKYSCNLIFDPNGDTAKKIRAAEAEVVKTTWPNPENRPKKLESCIRDGDEQKYDGYSGMSFIVPKASLDRQPGLVDEKVQEVIDPGYFYPGCYVRAEIVIYVNPKWARVNVGLNNVQRVAEGERLGGAISKPADCFNVIPDTTDAIVVDDEIDAMFG